MNQRPRYELLDGLRGVAAFIVLWYHIFEAFATSPTDQMFNHGYLAVDFFFILSGFVIGYAYDGRWQQGMTTGRFFLRRLIRLQPMVIIGVLLGAASFLIAGSVRWDGTHVALSMVMLATLINLFMLPVVPGWDCEVRGNGEMFPLNGPNWSLFFEYIGCIIYATIIRRLTTRNLAIVTAVAGAALACYAITGMSGAFHMGVGWTMADYNLPGGFLRLIFSFSAGLLMSRVFRPVKIRGAFWICTIALFILLPMPYAGAAGGSWTNGLYDALCILVAFPALVYIGACGKTTDRLSGRICEFLGDISYPVYVIHYPSMYLFYAWVWNNGYTFSQVWHVALMIIFGNILLAWIILKVYDQPVRKYLSRRFL